MTSPTSMPAIRLRIFSLSLISFLLAKGPTKTLVSFWVDSFCSVKAGKPESENYLLHFRHVGHLEKASSPDPKITLNR